MRSRRHRPSCRPSTCPGISISNFNDYADVIRRAGIYGPRDYKFIIENLIHNWNIDVMTYLNEIGRKAQEKIMSIPDAPGQALPVHRDAEQGEELHVRGDLRQDPGNGIEPVVTHQ